MKTYLVNEIFHSIQGEGPRAGSANIFLRLCRCNLACAIEPGPRSPGGFDCDTEFESGRPLTAREIISAMREMWPFDRTPAWVILTGGEPLVQCDADLLISLRSSGWRVALETNGSISVEQRIGGHAFDWITVSPKVAEHAIRQRKADEVRYVRAAGQGIPQTVVEAPHKIISPATLGDRIDPESLAWCIKLVKENPEWSLSVQMHKVWRVR